MIDPEDVELRRLGLRYGEEALSYFLSVVERLRDGHESSHSPVLKLWDFGLDREMSVSQVIERMMACSI